MIILEYQNIKMFLQTVTLQIGQKKFLWLKKLENTVPWTYVINDLKREEIFGTFFENKFNQTNQKEFRIEKVTKKKGDKLYVNGKVIIIGLIVGSIKKTV